MMKAIVELAKTTAVFLFLWGAIALTGLVLDAFPPFKKERSLPDASTEVNASNPDASTEVRAREGEERAGDLPRAESREKGNQTKGEGASFESRQEKLEKEELTLHQQGEVSAEKEKVLPWSFRSVCFTPGKLVWSVGDVCGDERKEVAIACKGHVDLIGWGEGSGLYRFARIEAKAEVEGMGIGDFDGDGMADLLISTDQALFWVRREASGAFVAPRSFLRASSGPIALSNLDGRGGDELAVVHEKNNRSEIWLFRGNASPSRFATLPAPLGVESLLVADLNEDGVHDIAALGREQLAFYFGDASGNFESKRFLAIGGQKMVVTDVGEDGSRELFVDRKEGACMIRLGPALIERAACEQVAGLDASFKLEGGIKGGLLLRRFSEAWVWKGGEVQPLIQFKTHEVSLLRLESTQNGWLLLVARPTQGGAHVMGLVVFEIGSGEISDLEEKPLADAPLMLKLALPDANAP
ncbi:MAG: VCBS repeat-containing protein [Sandaracinaceae bacterium]|nr:VCBS repeat-containing protein [Sandaracinaceae bacterium]